jgi:hypothetical protein
MALIDIIKQDLESIYTDLGNPYITFNGEDYPCIASSVGATANLEIGGFSVDTDLVITINKSLFTDEIFPKYQQLITYNLKNYRIISVRTDVTGALIRLFCQDDSRGI